MRYDIAIVGTGPAGISAALTAKSRNKRILLIGNAKGSEKIGKTHMIVNYPGVPEVTGPELNRRLLDQVKAAGIPITEKRVAGIYAMGDYFSLQADQDFLEASSVILTTGTSTRRQLLRNLRRTALQGEGSHCCRMESEGGERGGFSQ